MAATSDSGLGHGSNGSPQGNIEEIIYPSQEAANESANNTNNSPKYVPTPKHEPGHNYGSVNPIKTKEEGQQLLDSGIHDGKQVYNITDKGDIVKFQPDKTPNNGYHAYKVSKPRDIPPSVLKALRDNGKISLTDYNKYRKGKK